MKNLSLFFCLLWAVAIQAQVKIGDNPQAILPGSLLELESNDKAFVITRVSTAQMNSINATEGAIVYNTDVDCVHYYNGTAWVNICDAVAGSVTFSSKDSTITITSNGNDYDFKVNMREIFINGNQIQDNSIIQDNMGPSSVGPEQLMDEVIGSGLIRNPSDGSLQVNIGAGLTMNSNGGIDVVPGALPNMGSITSATDLVVENGTNATLTNVIMSIKDGAITNAKLANDAVTSDKIANGAVTDVKLADDAVTTLKILDANVTTEKIADSAVTNAKLANNTVTLEKIADGAVTLGKLAVGTTTGQLMQWNGSAWELVLGTDLEITERDSIVGNEVVDATLNGGLTRSGTGTELDYYTLEIALNGVETRHLAGNAVTSEKIADGAVITDKIVDGAINSSKILNGAVITDKIVDGAINSNKILNGAVITDKIVDGAINSNKILNGAVITDKIVDGAINSNKILDGAVITDKIADGAVITDKIIDGAINSNKILDGAVITDKIVDGAINSNKILDGAVITDKIVDGAINSNKILDGAVITDKIVDGAINSNKILDGAVITDKIVDGAINSNKILDGAVSTNKIMPGQNNDEVLTTNATGQVVWAPLDLANNAVTEINIVNGAVTSNKILDNTITNPDIAAGAAIAGTKINPDFGSYNILTTGTIGAGTNTPTSTLHTGGSFATSIITTTANMDLDDTHYTVILGGDHSITLPAANSCTGRIYIIKNISGFTPTISSYIDSNGTPNSTITPRVTQLQSDGTNWQQIN